MLRLHYAPDNASLIVRIALEDLGLPYQTVLVDRSTQEQKGAAFRRLNPRGLIPVLETPHGPMFETAAILLWLADTHGRLAPHPEDPGRPLFLSWMMALSNGAQTDLAHLTHPGRYAGDDPEHQAALVAPTQTRIRSMLDHLDALAGERHDWFADAAPSVLDIYVAVVLRWFALYPVGASEWFRLADWPRLADLAARLETRPSVLRAAHLEGLGPAPLSAPRLPTLPEGSAT